MNTTTAGLPQIKQTITVNGQKCIIVEVLPLGTVEVYNPNTGRYYRVSGLNFT